MKSASRDGKLIRVSLCSLWLCGSKEKKQMNHEGTKDTKKGKGFFIRRVGRRMKSASRDGKLIWVSLCSLWLCG